MGIVGPNGAGKSTLLRLLVGITHPTEGAVYVQGRVTGILELGIGFHPEFSGRDNALMNLALQGFDRDHSEQLLVEATDFSGLGKFLDRPLKTYSTGMQLRLAFAVATCGNPDVLVIDEALAVGDTAFQHRCLSRMAELKQKGATVILVSHDLTTVRHMCSQVLLLDAGQPKAMGTPDEVLDTYLKMVRETEQRMGLSEREDVTSGARWGSGEVCFTEIEALNDDGQPLVMADTGQPICFRLRYNVQSAVKGVVFGIGIYRSDGAYVHGSNHYWRDSGERLNLEAGDSPQEVMCKIPRLTLLPGTYDLSVYAYHGYDDVPRPVDHWERALRFKVSEKETGQHGIVYMDTDWNLK